MHVLVYLSRAVRRAEELRGYRVYVVSIHESTKDTKAVTLWQQTFVLLAAYILHMIYGRPCLAG